MPDPNQTFNPFDQWPDRFGKPNQNQQGEPNQQSQSSSQPPSPPKIGTGEGEIPLANPMPPKVSINTMASDVNAMKAGTEPQAIQTTPPSSAPSVPSSPVQSSSTTPSPSPMPASPETVSVIQTGKNKKGLFIGIASALIVIGVGALVYFFIYPLFSGGEETAQAPVSGQALVTEVAPQAPEIPTIPSLPEVPQIPETKPEEPVIPATPALETKTLEEAKYVSSFKTAPIQTNATLSALSLDAVKITIPFQTVSTPALSEYVLKNSGGSFVYASHLLPVLAADVFTENLTGIFNSTGSIFAYADDKGTWLGFVLQLNDPATRDEAKTKVAALEKGTALANLFLTDPGTAGTWKSGQAEGVSTRYLSYSLAGAGVNYGWLDNKLVIAGSYGTFKEAVKRLK